MPRPVIGVCAAIDQVRYGPWDEVAVFLPRSYTDAVQGAGGVALLLPPDAEVAEKPSELLDRLDALIITGGSDVDPGLYGAEQHPRTARTWPERDRFELAVARAALERDLPLLGICRGMQVVNVALGGTLTQHLPEELGDDRHLTVPGTWAEHEVRLEPGSLAARAAGGERITVHTHHHQGIDALGEGLVPTGWSLSDDLLEAIELPDRGFALGVLWHPEQDQDPRVIDALVTAAGSRLSRRRPREA
jgi:putative glutamine amidotransferase